jgi:hypothetical protein
MCNNAVIQHKRSALRTSSSENYLAWFGHCFEYLKPQVYDIVCINYAHPLANVRKFNTLLWFP